MAPVRALLLLALGSAPLLSPTSALQVPAQYGSMPPAWTAKGGDALCSKALGTALFFEFQFTAALPRFAILNGMPGLGYSDLGRQAWLDCNTTANASACSDPMAQLAAAASSAAANPSATLLTLPWWGSLPGGSYFTGVLVYSVLHLVLAILLPLGTCLFVTLRYGGPWLRLPSSLHCGSAFPTRKGRGMCGFAEYPGGVFAYPPADVRSTLLLLSLFLFFTLSLLVSGQISGNRALTTGLSEVTNPSTGLGSAIAGMLRGAVAPSGDLLRSLGSRAMGPLLRDINATLTQSMDLPGMVENLRCINASFANLPNGAKAQALMSDVAGSLSDISNAAIGLRSTLLSFKALSLTFNASASILSLLLGTVSAALQGAVLPPLAAATANATALARVKTFLLPGPAAAAPNASFLPLLPSLAADFAAVALYWPNASELQGCAGPQSPLLPLPPPHTLMYLANPVFFTGRVGGGAPPLPGPPLTAGVYSGGYSLAAPYSPSAPFSGAGALSRNLTALLTSALLRLPDLSASAGAAEALNGNVTLLLSPMGPLAGLIHSLSALSAGLLGIPQYSSYNGTLVSLRAAAQAVNTSFVPAIANSIIIRDAAANMPKLDAVSAQIASAGQLLNTTACLSLLVGNLAVLNASVFRLPSDFSAFYDLANNVNATLGPALAYISSSAGSVAGSTSYLSGMNATAMQYTFLGPQANFSALMASTNLATLPDVLSALDPAALRAQLATFAAQLQALNSTLAGSLIPLASIAQLRGAAANISALTSAVAYGAIEYAALAKGTCNASLHLCASSSDCPGNPPGSAAPPNVCLGAGVGVRRCAVGWYPTPGEFGAPGGWYPAAVPTGGSIQMGAGWYVPGGPGAFAPQSAVGYELQGGMGMPLYCQADADCPAPVGGAGLAACLGAYDRAAYLAGMLSALPPSDPRAAFGALAAQLALVSGSVGSSDVSGLSTALAASAATVGQLGGMGVWKAGIDASVGAMVSLDFSQVALLDSLIASISAAPIGGVLATFNTLTTALQTLQLQVAPVIQMSYALTSAAKAVFVDNSPAYVAALSYPALTQASTTYGLTGLLLALANVIDNATLTFNGVSSLAPNAMQLPSLAPALLPTPAVPSLQQASTGQFLHTSSLSWALAKTLGPSLDAAQSVNGYQDTAGNGAIYYLATLFLAPGALIRAVDQSASGVFVSTAGAPYPQNKLCLTSFCLANTVTALNTVPLASIPRTVFGRSAASLGIEGAAGALFSWLTLSREGMFLLLWLPAMLFLLLGIWSLAAFLCCTPARWQKVPASCLAGALCCWTPCALLLCVLLVPLAMVLSDACASGANIGQNLVLSLGDPLCPMLGGQGTAAACAYTLPLLPGSLALNFSLNLPLLYRGVIGGGDGAEGSTCAPDVQAQVDTLIATVALQLQRGLPLAFAQALGDPDLCTRILRTASPALLAATADFSIRPSLGATMCSAFEAVSGSLPPFVKDLGNTTISCGALGGAVAEVRRTVCANIVSPLWLFVVEWAVCAWVGLVLGIPAALAARKRFTSKPWGPQVLAAAEKAEEVRQLALLKSLGVTIGGGEGAFPPAAGEEVGSPRSPEGSGGGGSPGAGAAAGGAGGTGRAAKGQPGASPDSPTATGTSDGRSASRTGTGMDVRVVSPRSSSRAGGGLSPGALSVSVPLTGRK